ncbi:MAG: hypothetical protein IJ437_05750 [Clostridia bacterium]|nr:hypothetical protein [Clostridia bacterium]
MNSSNETKKNKTIREIDIRDLGRFLLVRSWIIAIAAILCIAVSLIYTSQITPTYTSKSSMMVVVGNSENAESWSVGHQIVQTAPDIISGNEFCASVADMLSTPEISKTPNKDTFKEFLDIKNKDDVEYIRNALYNYAHGIYDLPYYTGKLTENENYNYIYSLVKSATVTIDKDSPNTLTVSVNTSRPELSYIIANAITYKYQEQVEDLYSFEKNTILVTDIYETGFISSTPVNRNYFANALKASAVAVLISAAVLVVIFIFDDKIKTPDDIEKHLELNILGAIPDFESK